MYIYLKCQRSVSQTQSQHSGQPGSAPPRAVAGTPAPESESSVGDWPAALWGPHPAHMASLGLCPQAFDQQ